MLIENKRALGDPVMRQSQSRKTKKRHPRKSKEPAYSEDGVDLTLIRWMLSMTPAERLRVLQEHHRSIMKLRYGNRNM